MAQQTHRRNKVLFFTGNIYLVDLLQRLFKQFIEKKRIAKYFADTFWMSLKYKIQLSISLKRTGPNFEERERRLIVNCISSMWY
jgi:hypothetical protein